MDQKAFTFEEKINLLKSQLKSYGQRDMIVAFSGGVDSSILLKMCTEAAKDNRCNVYAVTAHTRLHPVKDLEIAKQVCQEAGAIHHIVYVDELAEAGIENNPVDRCYLCKKCIFSKLIEFAKDFDDPVIMEGTNWDDLSVYRPGIKALKELKIISPLADCGIQKEEVRKLAHEYGISVADRPSTPCMATRFPYGVTLDYERMKHIELGEQWFLDQGFYNVRLRIHGDVLRIEVDKKEFQRVVNMAESIIEKMKELGFVYITLDLEGFRSGSMDIFL